MENVERWRPAERTHGGLDELSDGHIQRVPLAAEPLSRRAAPPAVLVTLGVCPRAVVLRLNSYQKQRALQKGSGSALCPAFNEETLLISKGTGVTRVCQRRAIVMIALWRFLTPPFKGRKLVPRQFAQLKIATI